ncbi:YbaB/EbfC family nucleoid-associated protein [Neobacillus sp. C211]|uniref:Nucleoid-associated protein HFZ78_03700 n=1 Tax=Priestia megaterium TaxID=1404 RepID=A0A6H1PB45_PRIMG|nr:MULTISPECIES: YbaB/EbfC family nucleoid-associated protein [unclassified Bacillus (in: firmicutes)]QIZ10758.1 YbaB/EbfC family nucleoid-associated protein [Priestia megaterium]MBT2700831.1 YbaB/EbfC family nucleoid-associated protein [Bacillus sp. ISL-40]MBT2719752.1 YbaB/EbfC family nucleoid-associated protein [Bacillus sp. ISL-46]MBT2729723.1 YbaB/EbfC family nucleoid-associated protein [Bacillus sp. ISL-75]MBT2739068.1 YbaB/EbfC family nucleoid-associated protein [Bacillus sp. ISL-7]
MRGGGMGNMQNMMKQMQKMQKEMAKAQEELGEKKIEGSAGGGMVTVVVTGHKEVVDVIIKPEAVDPDDIEMLQDLVLAATNDALKKVEELTNSTMGQFTKGMNLPF